jgi:hexosaminidase
MSASELTSELFRGGIMVVPEPQEAKLGSGALALGETGLIAGPARASKADRFAAQVLSDAAKERFGIALTVGGKEAPAVTLKRNARLGIPSQGYSLAVTAKGVEIVGKDEPGLYYGVQTLIQLLRRSPSGEVEVPCLETRDWPDIRLRAIHYDTKHHQDTAEYVRRLIATLAHYKANMLIWEWEDKFAYESHPEVGAPGAFTKKEVQGFTRFAAQHHVQLVPLVQGLGHVSYILKHTRWRGLRELPDSNWEFCPLKDGSYELLFDLWDEAIEATPGSGYLHVGCDEAYELGRGVECGCKALADEHGRDHLMDLFLTRVQEHLKEKGRMMMAWGGRPDGAHAQVQPRVFVGWRREPQQSEGLRKAGHEIFCYDPNPGIEPLFLPFQPVLEQCRWNEYTKEHPGSLARSREVVGAAARSGQFDGMISTSWVCSGVQVPCWVPRFLCAAEYSWSGAGSTLEEWKVKFARTYFGGEVKELWRLYRLLQGSAWFYSDSFQRKVWHWGDVGKVHLPDLPRWEDLEYSPYWQRRYADWVRDARVELRNIEEELELIHENLVRPLRNTYDFELYLAIAGLFRHNARVILALAQLEQLVGQAHDVHFTSRPRALSFLREAVGLARSTVTEREEAYTQVVATCEKMQLPKGMSSPDKAYVHGRDRGRNLANRTADMRYLVIDEELLDLEGWADALEVLADRYEELLAH